MVFKIVRKIFILFVFIFIMIICTFIADQNENSKYYNIEGYEYNKIVLNQNDKFENEDFIKLINIANKNDVILMKEVYEYDDNDTKLTIYYSGDDIEKILKTININYTSQNKVISNSAAFASSYNSKDCNWKIHDLLNNKKTEIRLLNDFFNSDNFIYNEYRIFYKDLSNYDSFIAMAKDTFSNAISEYNNDIYGVDLSSNNSMNTILPISIIGILMLFYLVLEIYNIYNSSKKIGVMRLLGLGFGNVFVKLIKSDMIFYILLNLFILAVYYIAIPNVSFSLVFVLFILYLLVSIVFLVLSFVSLAVIYINKSMIDILKNKNIVSQLLKICSIYKFMVTALALLLLMITFNSTASYFDKIKILNKTESIGNWAFFAYVGEENDQYDFNDRTNLNKFYKLLGESNIEYLYEDFEQYNITEQEDINMTNEAIENGTYIPFATVDYNYLRINNIKIYDENNKNIKLTKKDHEYFIFPKEYSQYHQKFTDFYKSLFDDKNINIQTDYHLYTYTNEEIKQYHLNSNNDDVVLSNLILSKPIIRVTYDDYPINYFDDMYGLNLVGTDYTTGLKFKINKNKLELQNSLKPILEEAELDKVFKFNNFTTAVELMGNELDNFRNEILIDSLGLLMAISIYLLITIEINFLQLEKRQKEISVKLLLGFSMIRAFKKIYVYDILSIIIPCIGVLFYAMFTRSNLNINYLLASVTIILFENIVFVCVGKKINLNNLKSYLKGEK